MRARPTEAQVKLAESRSQNLFNIAHLGRFFT
jgi:hypothetical protein